MRRTSGFFLAGFSFLAATANSQTLIGRAVLPADTFASGPSSGQLIAPANGRVPPFVNKQPVQGVSSVLRTTGGDYLVMSDNGFGTKPNSPDYVLRVYRIDPRFKTRAGGTGTIGGESFFTLRDPDRKVGFRIVADETFYPSSAIPVDASIRSGRLLTGGDFDIESMRKAKDGTFWFGDEFGPFLIHTDASGKVLEAPIPLPGVQSPQNPFLGAAIPNLPRSRGFEGMAISPDGRTLYPMLEGALTTDSDQRRLLIYEFATKNRSYTGRKWAYRLDNPAFAIGDLTTVSRDSFLVIERDNNEGATARFKKIFLVKLSDLDADGCLRKTLVADLLNIRDPYNIGGFGATFTFPFQTIESVIPLSSRVLGVLDDNNYPFSNGRVAGQPDPNEFILIRLDRPLPGFEDEDDEDDD